MALVAPSGQVSLALQLQDSSQSERSPCQVPDPVLKPFRGGEELKRARAALSNEKPLNSPQVRSAEGKALSRSTL